VGIKAVYSKGSQPMIKRPNTIEERMVIANAAMANQEVATVFDDLPRKHLGVTNDGNTIAFRTTKRFLHAYTSQFGESLGLSLRKWPLAEVSDNLQKCFPACDTLDCDYLENVLSKLQLIKQWSQNPVVPELGERFSRNSLQVTRWISQQRIQLSERVEC
jgi:hypothetical protein